MRFARWIGGARIGEGFFERRGAIVSGAAPRGVVDALADLAHPGVDVDRIPASVTRFFLDTAAFEIDIESHWAFPFSILWPLFGRRVAAAIGQFVLPVRRGRIVTRIAALDEARDGRRAPRMIVRTYADDGGGVFQAAAYARDGNLMSCAFPQPLGHVAGFLRLENLEGGCVLESRGGGGAGVWLVLLGVPLPSPFSERFALFDPASPALPHGLHVDGAAFVGRHEQRLFGVRFVTHDYRFTPLP